MSESDPRKGGRITTQAKRSVFLHEGSFGCAYTPPIPCKKGRSRSVLKKRLVGKILPKEDVGAELSLNTLIRSIPKYEDYYILPEIENCSARNFYLARDDYAGECKLYQRKKNSELTQLVSPYGGVALHKVAFHSDFDYMKSFKHLLRGIKQLHEKGIVHFDLHMANVLLDYTGTLRIIDFGISFSVFNITKALVDEHQVNFSPGYAVEAPDLTMQRAVYDGVNIERALQMLMNEKKVLHIAAVLLGLSLEEQKESLRRFCYEDRSMLEEDWINFYKTYGFKWDTWCVGMIFTYILQDMLLQPKFIQKVWLTEKGKIRAALRSLLQTDPRKRATAVEALAFLE